MPVRLRHQIAKMVSKMLKPLLDDGVIYPEEYDIMSSNLLSIARTGELVPVIIPKLITQEQASEMLSISLANFKKMEREGRFPFSRRMVGTSVRYRNTDITKYILATTESEKGSSQ